MTADEIKDSALKQGIEIATDLKNAGAFAKPNSQIVALIAYLQKVGQFEKPPEKEKDNQGAPPSPLKPSLPDTHHAAATASN